MDFVERAKNGDTQAMKSMYESTYRSAYFVCFTCFGDNRRATDICTSLYKRVFKSIERLDLDSDFSAWIKNAAAVAAVAELKRDNPDVFTSAYEKSKVELSLADSDTRLSKTDTARLLTDCLNAMNIPEKCAVLFYYYNEMTITQTAIVMGVDEERVRQLLKSGIALLTDALTKLEQNNVTLYESKLKPILTSCEELLNVKIPDASDVIPFDIYLSDIPSAEKMAENPSETKTEIVEETSVETSKRKPRMGAVAVLTIAVIVLIISIIALATPKDEPTASSLPKTTESAVSSEIAASSEKETSSAVTSVKEEKKKVIPEYRIISVADYDKNDMLVREENYTFAKNGKLRSATSKSDIFEMTYNYTYSADGGKVTKKDASGKKLEVSTLDKNGNVTKTVFNSYNPSEVNFTWDYTYYDSGRVKKAKYTSKNSGSYTYKYNKDGQVTYIKHRTKGESYYTYFTYDDKGMVLTKREIDFTGIEVTYNYRYDYKNLEYSVSATDGTTASGKLEKIS